MLATLTRPRLSLRRRLRARETDTFLVSYPKSGGSWFYTLLANTLHGTPERPLDIFSAPDVIPDINGEYFQTRSLKAYADLPDPRFFFVHARPDKAFPKAICVIRDVRDVLVSYYHFHRMHHNGFDRTLTEFVQQDDFWAGRWDQFNEAWLDDAHGIPTHVVRYEDLLTNTYDEVAAALRFCGITVEQSQIEFAVEASSFKRMRQAEEHNDTYRDTKVDKNERFVRRGKAKGWVDELDAEAIAAIEASYGPTMRRLGYL